MIYVCLPRYHEAPTVGVLLWKIRQVFAGFPRLDQLLVVGDGPTDDTAAVLERYTRVLPLTVARHPERQGYAATIEELLRQAVDRTDRPKRDSAILMHADFGHGPHFIPDLVRRVESGADVVIAEGKLEGEPLRSRRLIRRLAPLLTTAGWAANAELYERTARFARRLETIKAVERGDLRHRSSRIRPWDTALE